MIRTRVRQRRALAAMLVAGTVALGTGRIAAASSRAEQAARRVYVVRPGDTLWRIAARLTPQADPRETVDRLVEVNHVRNGVIRPGERLLVAP